MKEIMILNRIVGKVREDGVAIKELNEKKHFFVKFNGYGINSMWLNALHKQNCPKIILLIEKENKEIVQIAISPTKTTSSSIN